MLNVPLLDHPTPLRPNPALRPRRSLSPRLRSAPRALVLACTLAMAGLLPAAAQPASPTPATPAFAEVWDLSTLFASDAAWEAERQALRAEVPALAALREGFGRTPAALRAALDRHSAFQQRLRRLWSYAGAHASTDNRSARNQERSSLVRALAGEAATATAWMDGALAALGEAGVQAALQAEPGLARHAVMLREAVRRLPHQLHPEAEAALAALQPVLGSATQARQLLVNAGIEWPQIVVEGKTERLNDTGYVRLRAHPDRAVRERVFQQFFATYSRFEATLGNQLAQRVEQGVVQARLRRHASAAAASLHADAVPETVLRTLVAEVNRGLPVLHRYLALRQRLLKLPDLAYHDLYPDMVRSERSFPPEVAAALTLASVAPLGAEYQADLARSMAANTMHVRPAPGKSSGAWQGGIYGQVPLIFLNHQDTFDSTSTFTHEWGHGMHSRLADRHQPFETARYPLFVAEIAAFTHELLLQEHMLRGAATREERLFFLGEALDRLRGAFFRQAMFAEFELAAHDAVAAGQALSGARMTQIYCGLLRKYHGADAGVTRIDPAVCVEWAYIPHFHRPFYVYQYATSMAAAQHFTQQLLQGGVPARERYLDVLRAGGSMHPVPLLQRAGLDMTQPEVYRGLVAQMGRLIDEMERLLAAAP